MELFRRSLKEELKMSSDLLPWVDSQISAQLPQIRATGEGKTVEFKREFPDQAHKVAQDLAAFGTCGGGMLFIGIEDNGELVGLDISDRDAHERRVRQLAGKLDPPLDLERLTWGIECERVVLIAIVGKQKSPIFQYDHRVYVRDGSISRPANAAEIIEQVWAHPSAESRRRNEASLDQLKRAMLDQHIRDNERNSKQADFQLDAYKRTLQRLIPH
jgi:predicted HTH transcriptional regulator